MIVNFAPSGKSFKGLDQYLSHDLKAATSERLAWTHTFNLASDHVPSGIHEMVQTFLDAEILKEEAGVKRGGRPLEKPVKHFSLDWHPDDVPTKEHMIATTEEFLRHMGWHEHQAIFYAHDDKNHAHVHVMLNAVHPETGLKLNEGLDRVRASEWALQYELKNDQVRCEQRLLPKEEREPAPQRQAWEAMKEAEFEQRAAEEVMRARADMRTGAPAENDDPRNILKAQQREEREAFFASGREAYKAARDDAFREVRESFREDWRDYYAAKRDGLDSDLLQEIKGSLAAQQQAALIERRDSMCTELREDRDAAYAALLAQQQADRGILAAHMIDGGNGHEWLARMQEERGGESRAANANDPLSCDFEIVAESRHGIETEFRQAAIESCDRETFGASNTHDLFEQEEGRGFTAAENPRVRDGIDIGAGISAAAIGGLTTLGERLFDGFLDDSPRPKVRPVEARPEARDHARNLFAEVANAARRQAEADEEEARRNEWWEERRARSRD